MQHAFNFTLEKMICLKKHNNSIKVGLFCLYFETKKMRFFNLLIKKDGESSIFPSSHSIISSNAKLCS